LNLIWGFETTSIENYFTNLLTECFADAFRVLRDLPLPSFASYHVFRNCFCPASRKRINQCQRGFMLGICPTV
jgi:hypothetical protein